MRLEGQIHNMIIYIHLIEHLIEGIPFVSLKLALRIGL